LHLDVARDEHQQGDGGEKMMSLKLHCVDKDESIAAFVAAAMREKLRRAGNRTP